MEDDDDEVLLRSHSEPSHNVKVQAIRRSSSSPTHTTQREDAGQRCRRLPLIEEEEESGLDGKRTWEGFASQRSSGTLLLGIMIVGFRRIQGREEDQ